MPFIVDCYRVNRQAKYKVFFQYHKEVVERIKDIDLDLRKWDSVDKCWVIHTKGLLELIKKYKGSNKIRFNFRDDDGRSKFIEQIKKIEQDEIEKQRTIKVLAQKKEQWVKLKDNLEKDFENYREITHRNLKEEVNLYPYQIAATVFINEAKNVLLALEMGLGKANPIDSNILTPNGWVKMGNLNVGDYVIGSNGKPTKVIGVYPQGEKDIYELVFNDNTTAQSCDEHLWNVNTTTKSLRQIMNDGLQFDNGNNKNYIPVVKPIEFEEKELKIDPYVLGCLLGDGLITLKDSVGFTTTDKEIINKIESKLPLNHQMVLVKNTKKQYYLTADGKNNYINQFLKEYDLKGCNSHTKFIPDDYKFSSINQRLEILRGIMDSDGIISSDGMNIDLTLPSKQLIEDVKFIVQSLGGIARYETRTLWYEEIETPPTYHRLSIKLPPEFIPFKLKRKIDRFIPPTKYPPSRAIKEVNYIGKKEAQCIMVDAEDHLYVMDNCVVTHNTLSSIAYVEMNDINKVFVITPNSLKFNFFGEVEKFTNSKAHIITSKASKYKNKYTLEESKYVIVNYEYFNPKDKKKMDKKFKELNVDKIDALICDECFTYNTLVDTDQGKIKIGDIVENQLDVKVLSYNHKLKKIEKKSISRYLYNGYKDVIRVKLSNGEIIECTPEHKFYSLSEDKYKPIKNFNYGEKIIKKKNRDTEIVLVESIEVLESENRLKFGRGGDQNKKVYDIEVIDNHNYFANNILVSNCQALKNNQSNTFKNFKRLFNDKIFKNKPSKVFLSGTPAPNRAHELYTVLNQISPIDFATKKYFNEYFCGMTYDIGGFGWVVDNASQKLEELFYKIAPYTYRKKKTDVLTDLPDKIYQKIILELDSKETKLYSEIEEDVVNEIYAKPTSNALTIMLRLRQYTSSIKINYIREIIDNIIDQGEKVVVVDIFKPSLQELHKLYPENSGLHTGDQSVEERAELVTKFQDPESDLKIFFASIQTANYGLTLTAASKMIIITLPFSVGQYDQVADRCILKGELVLTKDRGYIPIEDVIINELVYTHKGNWKKVLNKKNKIERNKRFYDINYKGFFKPLRCTEDHEIYVYDINENQYVWVEAKNLNINKHYMFLSKVDLKNYKKKFKIIKYESKIHNKFDINKEVELTNDLLYAFGRYVGDGWVGDHQVNICGHVDEYDEVLFSINSIKKSFNIGHHSEYIRENVITMTLSSMELQYNFKKWFNSGSENKIIPDFIFHLNKNQIESFLRGYYDADGYQRKNTQQASTVSKYLSYQLVLIEGMLMNKPTLKYNEHAQCWSVEYSIKDKIKRDTLIKNIEGNILYPISEIKQYKPKRNDERVYDLEIEDDNSFVVGLSSVHNCHRIGQKDTVNIYPLIFNDTLDEYVFDVIESKRREIVKALDNEDYESDISESVMSDVLNKLKNKYK